MRFQRGFLRSFQAQIGQYGSSCDALSARQLDRSPVVFAPGHKGRRGCALLLGGGSVF